VTFPSSWKTPNRGSVLRKNLRRAKARDRIAEEESLSRMVQSVSAELRETLTHTKETINGEDSLKALLRIKAKFDSDIEELTEAAVRAESEKIQEVLRSVIERVESTIRQNPKRNALQRDILAAIHGAWQTIVNRDVGTFSMVFAENSQLGSFEKMLRRRAHESMSLQTLMRQLKLASGLAQERHEDDEPEEEPAQQRSLLTFCAQQ